MTWAQKALQERKVRPASNRLKTPSSFTVCMVKTYHLDNGLDGLSNTSVEASLHARKSIHRPSGFICPIPVHGLFFLSTIEFLFSLLKHLIQSLSEALEFVRWYTVPARRADLMNIHNDDRSCRRNGLDGV